MCDSEDIIGEISFMLDGCLFLLDDLMDKLKEDGFSDYESVAGLCYKFEACIANGFDVLCKIRERL